MWASMLSIIVSYMNVCEAEWHNWYLVYIIVIPFCFAGPYITILKIEYIQYIVCDLNFINHK